MESGARCSSELCCSGLIEAMGPVLESVLHEELSLAETQACSVRQSPPSAGCRSSLGLSTHRGEKRRRCGIAAGGVMLPCRVAVQTTVFSPCASAVGQVFRHQTPHSCCSRACRSEFHPHKSDKTHE